MTAASMVILGVALALGAPPVAAPPSPPPPSMIASAEAEASSSTGAADDAEAGEPAATTLEDEDRDVRRAWLIGTAVLAAIAIGVVAGPVAVMGGALSVFLAFLGGVLLTPGMAALPFLAVGGIGSAAAAAYALGALLHPDAAALYTGAALGAAAGTAAAVATLLLAPLVGVALWFGGYAAAGLASDPANAPGYAVASLFGGLILFFLLTPGFLFASAATVGVLVADVAGTSRALDEGEDRSERLLWTLSATAVATALAALVLTPGGALAFIVGNLLLINPGAPDLFSWTLLAFPAVALGAIGLATVLGFATVANIDPRFATLYVGAALGAAGGLVAGGAALVAVQLALFGGRPLLVELLRQEPLGDSLASTAAVVAAVNASFLVFVVPALIFGASTAAGALAGAYWPEGEGDGVGAE